MRRITALLPLLLCVACTAPTHLVILHVNDLHGQIRPLEVVERPGVVSTRGGYRALSRYLADARAAADRASAVWVTDGGDWFQGTPEGNEDRGWSLMTCRNRLGLTVAAVGNHEYDFGEANLIRLIRRAEHPVLGANIESVDGSARPYVERFRVLRIGAVRVAVIGLITRDTPHVSTGPFGGARFADEVETVRRLLPAVEKASDAVVLLTHCGVEKDRELARTFPSILLILGGHSHTALPRGERVGDTWIAQSAGKATAISRIEVDVDQDRHRLAVRSVELVSLPAGDPDAASDPATDLFLESTFAHVGATWDTPIGTVTGARDERARGAARSTPGGTYVAELMRRVAGAEIGLTNKGGIRAVLQLGPITRRHVYEMLPFDNTVFDLRITGAQLRSVLCEGLRSGRQVLEIAGGRYGFRVVDGVRRLAFVEVGGRPVADGKVYRLATNSFLAGGGDGFTTLAALPATRASGEWLRTLMIEDIRARGGVVALDGESRIMLVE